MPRTSKPASSFRYFNSSPAVIRLVVLMYVRFPHSLQSVEDLLYERGIDICHEAAGTHARDRAATALGYIVTADRAERLAFASRHACSGGEHRIRHRVVDLILNRAVARRSGCH